MIEKRLKGAIEVTSLGRNKGSTFTITLPYTPSKEKEEPDQIKAEEIEEGIPSDSDEGDASTTAIDEKPKKQRKPSLRIATPNAVVKRLKFGDAGVTCCLDHLGEDGPE